MNQTKQILSKDLQKLFNNSMPISESIKSLEENPLNLDRDPEFVADYLKSQFVNDILNVLKNKNISKTNLAERMGKSKQYISRILNETANFTIDTIAQLCCALDIDINIHLGQFKHSIKRKINYNINITLNHVNISDSNFSNISMNKQCDNKNYPNLLLAG